MGALVDITETYVTKANLPNNYPEKAATQWGCGTVAELSPSEGRPGLISQHYKSKQSTNKKRYGKK